MHLPARYLPVLLLLLAAPASLFAASTDGGAIYGEVSNQVTRENLENAQVRLVGTRLSTTTDRTGDYQFTGLPPGDYTVEVQYPGLDTRQFHVTVGSTRVEQDAALNSAVYTLPQYVVAGEREGNAAAIAQQRVAPNIENAMTADAFGDIAKQDLGNFLKRIPGVVAPQGGGDTEPLTVFLRGMSSSVTTVDVDGTRAASPVENDRTQNIAAIPAATIEKIEVVKATTPHDDADSLGGRIELTTKSAYDLDRREIGVRLGGSYDVTYGKSITRYDHSAPVKPNGAFTYSDVYNVFGGQKNLGIVFQANYDKYIDGRTNAYYGPISATGSGSVVAVGARDYAAMSQTNYATEGTIRGGVSLRADYKLDDKTSVRLSSGFNRYDYIYQRGISYFTGGTVNQAVSNPDPFFTEVDNVQDRAQRDFINRHTKKYTNMFSVTSNQDWVKIYADFVSDRSHLNEYRNNVTLPSANRFNYTLDRREDAVFPTYTLLSGGDPFTDQYTNTGSGGTYEVTNRKIKENVTGSHLDFTKSIGPLDLQVGGRWRQDVYKFSRDTLIMDITAGQNLSAYLDPNWHYKIGPYPGANMPSVYALFPQATYVGGPDPRTAWTYKSSVMTLDQTLTVQDTLFNPSELDENLYATYAQATYKIGNLTLLGGARFEDYTTWANVALENATATDLIQKFGARQIFTSDTKHVFPGMHARYGFDDGIVLRASVTTTTGRPNRSSILSSDVYNLSTQTITAANPNLLPQYSTNYDVSLEKYFKDIGVVSIGAFQKDIKDYISTQSQTISSATAATYGAPVVNPSPSDQSWLLTTQQNIASAKVRGLEFNYAEQLTFLPGDLRNIGVFFNATWLKTNGYIVTVAGSNVASPLAGFVPRSGNVGISFTEGRVDFRTQVNYLSAYITSANATNPALGNSWKGERYQWDGNFRFKLTKRATLFTDLSNITKQGEDTYAGFVAKERYDQVDLFTFNISGGINLEF